MPPKGSDHISFTAAEVTIDPRGYRELIVNANSIDSGEILSFFQPADIVNAIGTAALLDCMTMKDVIDHFGEDELFTALNPDPDFR